MFGNLIYDLLFFGIPIAVLGCFFVCLARFLSARSKNAKTPGSFSDEEIKTRLVLLIVSAVVAGVLAAVVVTFIVLMFVAVAFM